MDPPPEGRGGKKGLPVSDIAGPIRRGAAPGLEPLGIAPGREIGKVRAIGLQGVFREGAVDFLE